jgi:hypothetical protein
LLNKNYENSEVYISCAHLISSSVRISKISRSTNKVKAKPIYPISYEIDGHKIPVVGIYMEFQWKVPEPANCKVYVNNHLACTTYCSEAGICSCWYDLGNPGDYDWYVDCGIPSETVSFTVVEGIPISTCEELQSMKDHLDQNYYLVQDINCWETRNWNDGNGFIAVGDLVNPYTGIFDGRYHKILYLYINRPSEYEIGLFGYVEGGLIENVDLEDVYINGQGGVGGLVGGNDYGKIQNSYSTGNVNGDRYVGGLIGYNGGEIQNSYFDQYLSGQTNCVGHQVDSSIDCHPIDPDGSQTDYWYHKENPPMDQWDFINVWLERDNNYPILRWQVE